MPRKLGASPRRSSGRVSSTTRTSHALGLVDGAPLTRSLAVVTGDAVGVYNVATAQDASRRGYGWAITRAAVGVGMERGCTLAVLQASEMGFPMYERHGFR